MLYNFEDAKNNTLETLELLFKSGNFFDSRSEKMLYKLEDVEKALIQIGYDKFASEVKELAEHDCIDIEVCRRRLPPKDYVMFHDILLRHSKGRYLPEKLDCKDFNNVLHEFLHGVGDTKDYEMQNHEEIAELVTELMKLIKRSSKLRRGKAIVADIFDEVCDVMCTTFIYGLKLGYTSLDIFNHMRYKFDRANQRYNENNEI